MKKAKQPKKKKTLSGFLAKVFLIYSILFFLFAIVGISDGVIAVFIFCLLFGIMCIFLHRTMKKDSEINEQILC